MAILAFQKPDKVLMLEADAKFGKFEFRPLEPGFGITVGNALRRILLSSLEGFAITTIRIEGVEHEFSSVPGVKEDVTNIILNLKQVRFKQVVEEFESEKVSITIENSSEFKAGEDVYKRQVITPGPGKSLTCFPGHQFAGFLMPDPGLGLILLRRPQVLLDLCPVVNDDSRLQLPGQSDQFLRLPVFLPFPFLPGPLPWLS